VASAAQAERGYALLKLKPERLEIVAKIAWQVARELRARPRDEAPPHVLLLLARQPEQPLHPRDVKGAVEAVAIAADPAQRAVASAQVGDLVPEQVSARAPGVLGRKLRQVLRQRHERHGHRSLGLGEL